MAWLLVMAAVVVSIAVANFTPLQPSAGRFETGHSGAKPSCGVPALVEAGRRYETNLGFVLLQTSSRSGVAATAHLDSQGNLNSSTEPAGLSDDASLLALRVRQRTLASSSGKPRVPLGMPGSAAALLTTLRHSTKASLAPTSERQVNAWVKMSILGLLSTAAIFCCLGACTKREGSQLHVAEMLSAARILKGNVVTATRTFTADGEGGLEISEGQIGKIADIDRDGDVLIRFDDIKTPQWVFNRKALEVLRVYKVGSDSSPDNEP